MRPGKHGARSTKQAIAIGLSKAHRAGVNLRPRPGGKKEPQATTRISRGAFRAFVERCAQAGSGRTPKFGP